LKPFLKWPGGKYRLVDRIRARLPKGSRLVEPFVGSAAVFLNTEYPKALLSDINMDLINLYRIVQRDVDAFITISRVLFTDQENDRTRYYLHRAHFNASSNALERAVLFLYLNRHGYNGLCRYNARGEFNVPFGRYTRPYFPERELRNFHERAQRAVFSTADFRAILDSARPGDVVYCDPPYLPLSSTANFTDYAEGKFGPRDQADLAQRAEALAARGVPVLISNHATPWALELYRNADVEQFGVQRFISCDGRHREVADEVLALFSTPSTTPP